ncbi:PepSY-associated TM helix domain-containing protein [Gilvimarinus xylanilyticus]|uniref:PepSY domain-containing protein n=1 Tax=Gilvimarinus xylanilyticus TaxID=2944139 RepID=A0A9X2KWX9_9GAMM|nr:PepSY-associated TM helix domain-containing protein [Gilvimarinus xylanilyticus]MCP8899730.1 PepSY domain-containing protein [Gilvimarinus xylanilyticus]
MRAFMLRLHRYMGLTIAVFLVITGVTGAIISWDHELDEWLNPHLNETHTKGTPIAATELAAMVEKEFPKVEVTYFELAPEPGHSQYFWVAPRVNPETGHLYKPEFNQVYVDPVSGEIMGKRLWGQVWPITGETFMSFLYKLHFSLHIPEFFDIDHWGLWLLGVIALIWTFDCFVGFYLTLPRNKGRERKNGRGWMSRWAPAWKIRRTAGPIRFNFDLHRALGLWTWLLLFIIAFTAFSLNLYREVFYPVMSMVSDVTPSPLEERVPNDHDEPITPTLTFSDIETLARTEGDAIGWTQPVGSIWYAREWGMYRVEYFAGGDSHGAGGVGHEALFFDGHTGEVLGDFVPWEGTAADIFVQAQFPLHSGRILGLPGRILISIMGIVVAALSITGVVIWWRKVKAKEKRIAQMQAEARPATAS